jgi:hypothetical protein
MTISESRIRRIIREELFHVLGEGIIDATAGVGRAAPVSPEERAESRAQDLANAKRVADTAAKKLSTNISQKKADVSKMSVPDLKTWVKDYGKQPEETGEEDEKPKATDPDQSKVAAAAVLNLSKRDVAGSKDMLTNLKDNPHLRNAVLSVPGMTDLQTAADMNLKAAGKDPKTAISDNWRELGKLSSKYGLAERVLRRLVKEKIANENVDNDHTKGKR